MAPRRQRLQASPSRATPKTSIIRAGSISCPMATCSSPKARPRRSKAAALWAGSATAFSAAPARLAKAPTASRCCATTDGDGDVDARHVFAENLNQPFGMALVGEYLYVGNTDAVVRFRYMANSVRAPGQPRDRVAIAVSRRRQRPLDAQHHRQPGRLEALRRRRLRFEHR